jgi:hypothetical protein
MELMQGVDARKIRRARRDGRERRGAKPISLPDLQREKWRVYLFERWRDVKQ